MDEAIPHLIIVAIIIIVNVSNGGKTDTSAAVAPGAPGAPLKVGDATVTSAPIAKGDATFGQTICTATTLSNGLKETISFNAFDWKLQTPSGTTLNPGFPGSKNTLNSGEIAPGGKASGDVLAPKRHRTTPEPWLHHRGQTVKT